uniref:GAR domain-containing protein n=1 Tax=Sinocyclocheilus anshuiensis TaxID=1608454 RepID=A0A671T9W6_9TELE
MLHGKHVMVRVGGGWDTLKGFLMKYDPDRVLQFTTLDQSMSVTRSDLTPDWVINVLTLLISTVNHLFTVCQCILSS